MKCEVTNCDEIFEKPLYFGGKKVCRKCYEELLALTQDRPFYSPLTQEEEY